MLQDLESKASSGESFSHEEAERVLACADLVSVGTLGELARRARHGDVVTYGHVLEVEGDALLAPPNRHLRDPSLTVRDQASRRSARRGKPSA